MKFYDKVISHKLLPNDKSHMIYHVSHIGHMMLYANTVEGYLVFSVTFSLHKILVALASQKLKGEMNIKEEFRFSLSFSFHSKIMKKVVGGMLSRDRLWLKGLLV